ncbi:MAG: carbamoyl-phosphate synthase large subunit [Acidimicrobiia bacterium]|nr:carbamoyl-phosphate synthase large subunit [Acidimicrobiia bacterium]
MPRRTDIESILIIGSGPIVIGQACEFDYSGTQACKVLADEGFRVILANSNPATIMTDPEFADATYVEPLDVDTLRRIIDKERPDALLPTLGGQTGLNLAVELHEAGVLEEFGVEMIGANIEAIHTAENRDRFKAAMTEIGLKVPESAFAHTLDEAMHFAGEIGYPLIVRPSFILGGAGTGLADDEETFRKVAERGLAASPVSEILIERSIAGWKEYELELMRDHADNCVVICSIENFDPMGVHTGDSITVAPAQTLTDVEYQLMRDAAFACIRRIGVDTGGSNIQFAVNPADGDMVVIEMNPRVSRSSALASKATGFPIAKIAAKLAVGYRLDEILNDITKETPASFEPTIDYVVTKIPRWAFEKFPDVPAQLTTRMQSVGEVMAIGRTFTESVQKAMRSLEQGRAGLNADAGEVELAKFSDDELLAAMSIATPDRIGQVHEGLNRGLGIETVHEATKIDPWFLDQLLQLCEVRQGLEAFVESDDSRLAPADRVAVVAERLARSDWRRAKRFGFSDAQLAWIWARDASPEVVDAVRVGRLSAGVAPTFKTVDTCAAEFAAYTPYYYSTYEDESELTERSRPRVVILGSGPNRIGQGVEFDYCCVHAAFALSEAGYDTVMVNCNPETVSTDYDTSDQLFFEPLTEEDVRNICEAVEPVGVIVSLGGQTPLKLARRLEIAGIPIAGTAPAMIDLAEDREQFNTLCDRLGVPQPAGGTASSTEDALKVAASVGYPALVRPSYVLGGRAMEIVYDDDALTRAMRAFEADGSLGREGGLSSERPVLIDRFLEGATEVDVDAVRDSSGAVLIGGIMEHIEQAGIHSGDSACVIPPATLSAGVVDQIRTHTLAFAEALSVVGLINIQYAVKDDEVFVIEVNPRASRTVPFVAKATGVPLAKVAARVALGATLAELEAEGLVRPPVSSHVAVKEAVLPFNRFPESDTILGPEMRSTGEVMGIDASVGWAFLKSQLAAGTRITLSGGTLFISLAERDKTEGLPVAAQLADLGWKIVATAGTAQALSELGVAVDGVVAKVGEQTGQDAVSLIAEGKVDLVINTPRGHGPRTDGAHIRHAAVLHDVPCLTTVAAAQAAALGLVTAAVAEPQVRSLQEYHSGELR